MVTEYHRHTCSRSRGRAERPDPDAKRVAVIVVTGLPQDIEQVRKMLQALTDREEPAPAPTVRAVIKPDQLDLLGGDA